MIGNPKKSELTASQREGLMRAATYCAVLTATVLIFIKGWAYLATDSVSILSTFVDSLLDLGASLVNLLAVRQALVPPDDDHRFGHGKAEALAGLLQSAFIVGSALFLVLQATERLANPEPVHESGIGIIVMGISIALTLMLVSFQRYVIKRSQSVAISADSLHYTGDILVNVSVIVALILADQLGWIMADALFAIGIAGYISYNAWSIVRLSFADLMDEELPDEERDKIIELVTNHPDVLGVHDLRTRRSGQKVFIQMHLDLMPDLNLAEAHIISEAVEASILASYPDAEALIHQDPAPQELVDKIQN
ncbi:divalent metal cation transporter FieF [Alphaproteobacteria bacterium 46_93_T64]|nr:divalent metal cation transporter FieF [Alphaproteobacteria bacterium 46_93_T64]